MATGSPRLSSDTRLADGLFLEQYVNTETLLPHCDLVCCHGGNGTLYQALWHGLPSVVVTTHAEQYYGGKRIQQLGLGRALTLEKAETVRYHSPDCLDTASTERQDDSAERAGVFEISQVMEWGGIGGRCDRAAYDNLRFATKTRLTKPLLDQLNHHMP